MHEICQQRESEAEKGKFVQRSRAFSIPQCGDRSKTYSLSPTSTIQPNIRKTEHNCKLDNKNWAFSGKAITLKSGVDYQATVLGP